MRAMISRPAGPLAGRCRVPGDKSISHRALILGASAIGESVISGLLEADDVMATAAALRALGARIIRDKRGLWRVGGVGVGGLTEPDGVLDLRNSGTGARLLIGLCAAHTFAAFFTGDASLRRRPMRRIIEPLRQMGAEFLSRTGDRLPLVVSGSELTIPITYRSPVASAQIKSAILLCGLNTPGITTVIEPIASRDHSERLLRHFDADVTSGPHPEGGWAVSLTGQPELTARDIEVPGDISSAAFPLVGAGIVAGSSLRLDGIGVNPLRTGLLTTLQEMGAALRILNTREICGEPVADLQIDWAPLRAVRVTPDRVPAMIDEFPILAVAAACARGTTRLEGLGELRVKESDRLTAIAAGLRRCGVAVAAGDDWLEITGDGSPPAGGGPVGVALDHRIAMAFLVLGMASAAPVVIDDGEPIATSFPDFAALMNTLGAAIADDPHGHAAASPL
jgi:3-phosphoshikimate 1-carboxyvinyltransferase